MSDREIFQENFNFYLSTRGKSQKDLADFVGVTKSTVSGWSHGISYPRADTMEKICDYFQISLSMLVESRNSSDDEYPPPSSDEHRLISSYRSLNPHGQELLLERAEELKLLHGKKPEGSVSQPG